MPCLLTPEAFFSLEQFSHAALFKNCHFVWEALGKLSLYLEQQELGVIETELSSSVYLVNLSKISIGMGTVVEPGAFIEGPCIIGKNCTIRHGAYIRGNVVMGDGCVIGHDTEVKHSIFLNRAKAPHFNYVGDSILGNDVNLGAGVKCANTRFDHQPIIIVVKGAKLETRLTKLGAIVGDGAQVGCNCVTNPGTLLGKGCYCYPCLNVHGFIPEKGKVKPNHLNIIVE
jgi:NDP-sugar pyrophosphorylase family protein